MSAGSKTMAQGIENGVDPSGAPVRAKWILDNLLTTDGHRLTAHFSCSLRILSEPAERKFFEETFLNSSPAVSINQILAHFQSRLQAAAVGLASREMTTSALEEAAKSRWIEALRAAGEAIAFSCGIGLLAPMSIELSSPSLQHERLEEMQRAVVQRTNAQRVEHFERAASLLQQWESLKVSTPSITPGQVLEQLNPTDRGAMLETLLMASARRTKQPDLWAVAGPHLVRVSFEAESSEPRLFSLPTTAGPLRSVQLCGGKVVVGAQKGVIVVDAENSDESMVYLDPDVISEHGFTRAILEGNELWGCHRDGGVVRWDVGGTDRPAQTVRSTELGGGAKHLTACPNLPDVFFTVGERVLKTSSDTAPEVMADLSAPIVSILVAGDQLIVVAEDGNITFFDSKTAEKISAFRSVGRVSGASLLPWLNTARLLLTTPDGPVQCVGLDDQLVTQYGGPHLGLQAVSGSPGKVAAMSGDRQRVIFWNTWDGRRPISEIHLTGLTRHRIADITF
jgi:hypothetical protein